MMMAQVPKGVLLDGMVSRIGKMDVYLLSSLLYSFFVVTITDHPHDFDKRYILKPLKLPLSAWRSSRP
jgi:hypothetical protein